MGRALMHPCTCTPCSPINQRRCHEEVDRLLGKGASGDGLEVHVDYDDIAKFDYLGQVRARSLCVCLESCGHDSLIAPFMRLGCRNVIGCRCRVQVVKESMRLHPPITLIGRQVKDETDVGEYR